MAQLSTIFLCAICIEGAPSLRFLTILRHNFLSLPREPRADAPVLPALRNLREGQVTDL